MTAFTTVTSLRGHINSINVLAFSPDGTLLASGADDNHIIIYDLQGLRQIQRIDALAPVTSILWSTDVNQFYAGFGDGRVLIVSISLAMDEFTAYHLPWRARNGAVVGCLAPGPDTGSLVACVGSQVVIWRQPQPQNFTEEILPPPDALSERHASDSDSAKRQGNVGSSSTPNSGSLAPISEARAAYVVHKGRGIIIAYLRHGIHYWDLTRQTYRWCIDTCVGRLAISPNEEMVAVSNLFDGFDIYCLKDQSHLFTISTDTAVNVPLPITFIHAGSALLMGSSSGQVIICKAEGGDTIQTLICSDKIIQALACWGECERTQLLATGCSERGALTAITLWRLEEDQPDQRSQAPATGVASQVDPKRKTSRSQQTARDAKCLSGVMLCTLTTGMTLILALLYYVGYAHGELRTLRAAPAKILPSFWSSTGASTAWTNFKLTTKGRGRWGRQHLLRFLLRLAKYLQELLAEFIVYVGDDTDL